LGHGAAAFAVLLAGSAFPAWGQEPSRRTRWEEDSHTAYGPFRFTSVSPFHLLRPGFAPRVPSSLEPGAFEARLSETWANMWAFNEDDWILDYEVLTTTLALAFRASPDLLVELELEDAARFGGRLDSMIINFHRSVGAEQRHRDDFSRHDFRFDVVASHGQPRILLDKDDTGSFSETAVLSFQYDVVGGADAPLALTASGSLRADLRNPDGLRGGSPVDAAISVGAARRVGEFYWYGGVNAAWFGHEEFEGVDMRATQVAAMAAVEWKHRSRISMVVQYLFTEGALENPKAFRRPTSEILVGLKWRVGNSHLIDLAGMENFIIPDNSADFGFHAGLTVRW